MPCKSVFLLQIKYIEKFKLLWQLKIFWGGIREVKLYYYAMKGIIRGGGSPAKTIFQKSSKKSKTKIKKSTRNFKVSACGFNLYYCDPDYLLKHISSSTLPLPPNKSSVSQPKFNGKLSHWGGTGSH